MFTFKPATSEKDVNSSFNAQADPLGPFIITTISAYIVNRCSLPSLEYPFTFGLRHKILVNGSREKVRSSGDKGQPCFVPLQIAIAEESVIVRAAELFE